MRICAVSDMHGKLANVFQTIDASNPDLLLCCGDWGDPDELDQSEVEAILSRVKTFCVYGNHDDIDFLSKAANEDGSPVLLRAGDVREWGGVRFAGISGIWAKSNRQPYYVTNEDVAEQASAIASKGADVLLSHGCPIGIADTLPGGNHGGQHCFLDVFHDIKPRLYLCGHLHAAQQRILKDGRIIVNIGYTCEGDYWVFDVTDEAIHAEHFRL